MGNWLREQWEQIRGEVKWWAISGFAKWVATGWTTLMVAIATTLGLVADLPGYQIFFLSLSTFTLSLGGVAFCMFITNQARQWWVFKQWERGERPLPSSLIPSSEIQPLPPSSKETPELLTTREKTSRNLTFSELRESQLYLIPSSLSREQTTTLIAGLKHYNEHVKLKIVSAQTHIEFAKQLTTIFRIAGYTFIIDEERHESIFLARSTHNKIVLRFRENTSFLSLDSNLIAISLMNRLDVPTEKNPFPPESDINYLQIEIGGAP